LPIINNSKEAPAIMKKKTISKLIQGPLRFHHQDIHEELEEIKGKLDHVSSQMQVLQQRIDWYIQTTGVWLPKSDVSERGQDLCD
jgi:hypothetical protein